MKVLVTGATGFIGSHLAKALAARGYQVNCLVRRKSQTDRLAALGVDLVYGNVNDPESVEAAVRGVDHVIHLAGLIKALSYTEFLRVNEQGTANVAAACAAQETPPVLVVVSSLAAAGPAPDGRPRIETDPAEPVSNYGRSKRAGELAATRFAGRVPLSIVRPPVVFGEGDPAMLAMYRPIKWLATHVAPGRVPRQASMIHAADLAQGIVAVAERGERVSALSPADDGRSQGVYYLADDVHPSFAEWGQLISRSLGRRRLFVFNAPRALLYSAGALTEAWSRVIRTPSIFNVDKVREGLAGSWTCSADRAKEQLGFAVAAPLEERWAQTTLWYRRHGWI